MKKAWWILALAGCASPAPAPAPKPEAPEAKVEIQAENPEWQKITEELLKGRSVPEQQKILEAERRYQLALAWFHKGDFEKTRIEAQLAVQAWPEHLAARKLLADAGEIIVGAPTGLRAIG